MEILKERREKGITAEGYNLVTTIRNWDIAGKNVDNLSVKYVFD